ncbi:hypothetical protein H0H92_013815, partial [Tricholoma furcatifolium]
KAFNSRAKISSGSSGPPVAGESVASPIDGTYFRRLIGQYGGLVSLNVAGFSVVLIGDLKLAKELLDKHSIKHSSRPAFYYMLRHVDPEDHFWAFSKDGSRSHFLGRKLTAEIMSDVRAGKTELLQEFESLLNVQLLLNEGGMNWFRHMERYVTSIRTK